MNKREKVREENELKNYESQIQKFQGLLAENVISSSILLLFFL